MAESQSDVKILPDDLKQLAAKALEAAGKSQVLGYSKIDDDAAILAQELLIDQKHLAQSQILGLAFGRILAPVFSLSAVSFLCGSESGIAEAVDLFGSLVVLAVALETWNQLKELKCAQETTIIGKRKSSETDTPFHVP